MSVADIVSIAIAALVYVGLITMCFVVGSKWSNGKWLSLAAGYNTETKEKKENYDTQALFKFLGIVAYINGILLIIVVPVVYISVKCTMYWLIYIIVADIVIFDIFAAIHSNKYKK